MPGGGAEYARLPVTEIADDLSSEEEDDLYTRPPRRPRPPRPARGGKAGLQAPAAFREAATRPVKRYQLLDEEDALGALQVAPDIRQPSRSPVARKACLFTVCLLALIGVSVAAWFVPCQWYGCSDSSAALQQSSVHRDYEVMLPGIVATTQLLASPAVYRDSADLVFGFRRQDSAQGGLTVVAAGSGHTLWQQQLYEAPVDLQCGAVDLNGDGVPECLLTGGASMMALIDMQNRQVAWYLHEHNSTLRPASLLPPLPVTDLTSDGVTDLLVAGLLAEDAEYGSERQGPPRTQLMIVDGATGAVLSKGAIPGCPMLLRLAAAETPSDVTLECMAPLTGVTARTESLTALTERLRTEDMAGDVRVFSGPQESADTDGGTFQVQLENAGVCPRCHGRLTLLDGAGAAVWSTSAERARLHSVQQFTHRNHTGLVYKLWSYPTEQQLAESLTPLRRSRRWWHSPLEDSDAPLPTLAFEEAASVTQSSEGIRFRYQHPLQEQADAVAPEPADGWEPEFFTESVWLVRPSAGTGTGAGLLTARRLDSVQVTRFCGGPGHQRCQPPALADNTVTAAVLDVGGDGDLDLVSVTSLFVPEGEVVVPRHRHQCSLQTRLRKRQLYGEHWRETLSETVQPTERAVSEAAPTGQTPLP